MTDETRNQKRTGSDGEKFPVPFSLGEIKENISNSTNSNTQTFKEQIINQAFKFHLEGNISEASKYYKYFISQGFIDERVFSNYGVILNDLGKLQDAELSTRKAIEINPDFADAHYNLGNTLKNLGKFQEAKISYSKAIEIKPNFAKAYSNLGIILNYLGNSQEALVSLRKAIKLNPNLPFAHRELAICLYLLGNTSSALNSMVKANLIDPKDKTNEILLNFFNGEKSCQNSNLKKHEKRSLLETSLDSNPLMIDRPVERELIDSLYKIKSRDQEKYQAPTYGDAKGSDYKLFERSDSIIKKVKEDLTSILMNSVKSDILIEASFFTIFSSGGGLISHNHLTKIDKLITNLSRKKFSLVYYLSVGDQNCDEPGVLKLENPNQDILPHNSLIVIFSAERKHSVFYKGQKDRIIIGVNFYSI